jgi:hypothetical protein
MEEDKGTKGIEDRRSERLFLVKYLQVFYFKIRPLDSRLPPQSR